MFDEEGTGYLNREDLIQMLTAIALLPRESTAGVTVFGTPAAAREEVSDGGLMREDVGQGGRKRGGGKEKRGEVPLGSLSGLVEVMAEATLASYDRDRDGRLSFGEFREFAWSEDDVRMWVAVLGDCFSGGAVLRL